MRNNFAMGYVDNASSYSTYLDYLFGGKHGAKPVSTLIGINVSFENHSSSTSNMIEVEDFPIEVNKVMDAETIDLIVNESSLDLKRNESEDRDELSVAQATEEATG